MSAEVSKIDSNITGLAYAEEFCLGELPGENSHPGVAAWYRLQPNSYSDFGGELITVTPRPINDSRQNKKGVGVDLNASGGFNHNFSQTNLADLLQGVMFADTRLKGRQLGATVDVDATNPDKYLVADTAGFLVGSLVQGFDFTESANNAVNEVTGVTVDTHIEVADGTLTVEANSGGIRVIGFTGEAGDLDVDTTGSYAALTSTNLDFTTLGLVEGQWIFIGGDNSNEVFVTAANNGFKRIRSIQSNRLTLDKSVTAMVTESSTTETIHLYFGDVLRNESGNLIKRRSYNLERTLGSTTSGALAQTEVLTGSVLSEFVLNIPTAELVNSDISFVSINHIPRDSTQGPKQANTQNPAKADVFNTTSDFSRIKMSVHSTTDEAPEPLFAFITEATITINNNLTVNKAVGTMGGFDITAGTFTVSGSVTAYFSDVAAITAVRNSSDVTFDFAMVKDNQGIVLDLPLVALGDGRLNVEQDQPITLPLNLDAATAEDIDTNLDYTAMFTFFNYLPNAAE